MFMSGMNPTLGSTFMVSTLLIAVPSAIKVFNWMGTMWRGNLRFPRPDAQREIGFCVDVHDRRPVRHLHGGDARGHSSPRHGSSSWPISTTCCSAGRCSRCFAAIPYWYPKMFGRMMSERNRQAAFLF